MSVKRAVQQQYQTLVNRAAVSAAAIKTPSEGWLMTVRKALGMSGAQLARRMGVTRARIGHAEQAELNGTITLNSMKSAAEAMGCRFVYAIVPAGTVENVVSEQARKKATAIVGTASKHMALENQTLPKSKIEQEVARVTRDLTHEMPSDFWDDK